MPTIGGVNIAWDEGKPAGADSLGIGDDQIRSDKTAVRTALAAEHVWESTGGANTGAHALGSARPFYGVQSAVSSSGSDGRLMATSDTSRLFGVGSGGTVLYGGATVLSAGSYPGTVPQRSFWAVEFGQGKTVASGTTVVSFPNSGFSQSPFIFLTPYPNSPNLHSMVVANANTANFTTTSYNTATAQSSISFYWQAIGLRAL